MKRKLLIDGQLFQTPAWHRGMGKYSLELLAPLVELMAEKKWSTPDIILSKNLKTEDGVEAVIKGKLPGANLVYLNLRPDEIGNETVPQHNRLVISEYVEGWQQEGFAVDFLILSLMQGEIHPVFPAGENIKKLVIMYDLIPLMFHDIYLRNTITQNEYLPRIGELLKADTYLAISKTVANDLALYLGVDKSRIASIDGGPIPHSATSEPMPVPGPFILMPTGNDLRKNNQRAILGFKEFNKRHQNKYSLLITSFFKDHEKEQLGQLATNVVFTGNISGGQMNYLYDTASALLFPSEYEGLGMPILEALEHNKPIACSNIAVFREMSATAFHTFDPYSIVAIGDALEAAVASKKNDQKEYTRILGKYTWQRSAEVLFETLERSGEAQQDSKPKLAIVGANPVNDSFAARVMQENHAELSRLFDIDYYLDSGESISESRVNYLPYITHSKVLGVGVSLPAKNYQEVVYHLGNDSSFALPLFYALGCPGVVVLHDLNLEKAWQGIIGRGLMSKERIDAEDTLEAKYEESGVRHLASLIGKQHSIIVFSREEKQSVERLLKKMSSSVPVFYVPLPIPTLVYSDAIYEKTANVLNIQQLRERIEGLTDFRSDMEIGKLKGVVYDTTSSMYEIVRALCFGILAFRDDSFTIESMGIEKKYSYEKEKGRTIIASREFPEYSISAIEYTQSKHNEYGYAHVLKEILNTSKLMKKE